MSQPHRKRRKIALACTPCRARKIRCDGVEPTCGPCKRRETSCSYPGENARKIQDNQ
ncbi:hypothetical protein BO94DRAFT_531601 [Aspergillus sclerotioniger CBS 115572]|uniref:Zn(2)-C6 fungal-type domain-containing protein n=1 Tax=Aspergillus sclerotioniger CBS 115572 TaxID=1450535 RepID=A0A317X8Q3_9EURO|nr:hypothetical protein BO94DRAFT_531601 [Aspergillus sclerotioniger CBS 115572]PWY94665.1 hypothetical protein BO94DRAFT_531601 [Aspergillus sclerotioniger CBS 115572]